jgi:hypothetical protein
LVLGSKAPLTTLTAPGSGAASTRRTAWHPTHADPAPAKLGPIEPIGKTEQTGLKIDPEADDDRFSHFEADTPAPVKTVNPEDVPTTGDLGTCASKPSRWRPARSTKDGQIQASSDR